MEKSKRGFALMDPHRHSEIATQGGLKVSANRQHMSEIGSKGGAVVSKNREHMREIGRKGGRATQEMLKSKITETINRDSPGV